MCGTSTALHIDDAISDVSDVDGPKIAATPSSRSSQTGNEEWISMFLTEINYIHGKNGSSSPIRSVLKLSYGET